MSDEDFLFIEQLLKEDELFTDLDERFFELFTIEDDTLALSEVA